MSANIFISHASEDRKVATTLCTALENRGFQCWIATRDIPAGENFQIAIVRAIRNAKMMLLVFTANSNASEEMSKELALASKERLIVVPLRVEDVSPNDAFAYEFATRQWIDFFADWEAAINQLCIRIANAMPPEPAAPAPAPAPVAVAAASAAPVLEAPPKPVVEPPSEAPAPAPTPPAAEVPKPAPAPEPVVAKPAPAAKREPVKPAPTPPPAAKSEPVKPPAPPKPAVVVAEEAASEPKSRVGLFAVIGVLILLVVGLGLAVPAMMGKKPGAQASVAPAVKPAAQPAAVSIVAPIAPVAAMAPAAPPAAVVTPIATNATAPAQLDAGAASNAVADPAAAPVVKPHHHAHAASSQPRSDVPY